MTWRKRSSHSIQSGEWIISKYFMPEPIYTLWRGSTRIDNFKSADDAKQRAGK